MKEDARSFADRLRWVVALGDEMRRRGMDPVVEQPVPVEGVVIEQGAVLGANVSITASTPIIDVTGPEPVEHRGRVPANSVVLRGSRPKQFPAGTYELSCALIVGQRKESTDEKTSLNDALRVFEVPL